MRTLAVDGTNALTVDSSGNLAIVTDLEACLQTCARAVKAQRGEMLYAADQGLPTFATIWAGIPNPPQFEAAARATLLAVSGVTAVKSFTSSTSGGIFAYKAVITTIYGDGVLNG